MITENKEFNISFIYYKTNVENTYIKVSLCYKKSAKRYYASINIIRNVKQENGFVITTCIPSEGILVYLHEEESRNTKLRRTMWAKDYITLTRDYAELIAKRANLEITEKLKQNEDI